MALVKFGGGITQMAGSIAGNVFARNRYGNYVRARTKPTNPNTARQQVIRAALAQLTTRWSDTLTAAQRAAWDLYAANVAMLNRLGESTYLSGYNHYIRSNVPILRLGGTIVDAGPTTFELPAQDPTLAVTASEATQQLTVAFDDTMDFDNETGGYLMLAQGSPQNPQRNFFAGPYRIYAAVIGVTGSPVASPSVSVGGFAIAEGQHQWITARIIRADGRLSEPFRDDCFVGA